MPTTIYLFIFFSLSAATGTLERSNSDCFPLHYIKRNDKPTTSHKTDNDDNPPTNSLLLDNYYSSSGSDNNSNENKNKNKPFKGY